MKKKILAAVLCVCIAVQSMELSVFAAGTLSGGNTAAYTDGDFEVSDETEEVTRPADEISDTEERRKSDETQNEEKSGTQEETQTEEGSVTFGESENEEESMTFNESENEDEDEDEDETSTESEEEAAALTETMTEEAEVSDETQSEEESDTFSENEPSGEMIGEAVILNTESGEDALLSQSDHFGEVDTDTDISGIMSVANANQLSFGYSVEDSEKHTGILTEYLSESGTIVLPHKLGGYYMVGIGDGVFSGMAKTDNSDLSKLPQQSDSGKTVLSDGEQKILDLVNELRTKNGRMPLVMHTTLREAARRKSLDMMNRNYFDHQNTDGTYTYHWLQNCGYPYGWWAENIAYNYSSAEMLFEQWKNSPGHYRNMMNPNLRAIGIGVYRGSNGQVMGTQIFSDTVFQNLVDVTLEYGYEKIGNRAFSGCSNLRKITIPSTVAEISETAFLNCPNLTIYGKAGSYAQKFAGEQNIPFSEIEEKCPVKEFKFAEKEIFMEEGDMDFVKVTVKPADYEHLIKISERPAEEIVIYREDGTLQAVGNGETVIGAQLADMQAQCRITVGIRTVLPKEIRFFEDELTLYEGESIKPAYQVMPLGTTEKVQMDSSEENVFTVDEDGVIVAKGAGQATLTISAGEVSDSLTVNVKTVKKDLVLPQDLKAVTNVEKTLGEVSLEDYPGFTWKEPNVKLKARKDEPIQYFAAQYQEGGTIIQDCLLPVAVSSISEMTVSVEEQPLASGKKLSLYEDTELCFGVKAVGAEVDPAYFDVECSVNKPENVLIKGTGQNRVLQPQAVGKIKITVIVRLKDKSGSYGPKKKPYGTYKKTYTIHVEDSVYISELKPEIDSDMSEGVQVLEDNTFLVEEGVQKFRIRVNAFDKDGNKQDTALAFSADKSKKVQVTSVKGQNGLAEVTVKKSGEAVISVKAKDGGKRSIQIKVQIKNLTPQLKGKAWTLNKYKPAVTAQVDLQESKENPICGVTLFADKELQSVSTLFAIQKTADIYSLGFLNTGEVLKSSYKLFLKVSTQTKEYVYPITVKLKNTKPSVTLKQVSKLNLFYKDADAQIQVKTGKEIPEKIEQINVVQEEPHFEITFTEEGGTWSGTIHPVGVTAQNYKKVNKKIELRFRFKDFADDFFVKKTFNVGSVYKKAGLTSVPSENMIYLTMGNEEAVFHIMEKTTKEVLVPGGAGNTAIKLETGMENKVEMQTVTGSQDITFRLPGEKSLTVKTMVSHDNWQEPVKCSFKLTVNKKMPSLALEKTKITLNSGEAGKEVIVLKAFTGKNEKISIARLKEADISGSNAASQKLLNDGKISICPQKENGIRYLKICLNDSNIKNGTYKFKIYGWCMSGESIRKMSPATLSIVITNKKPSVFLKAKGKINLKDLKGSAITYTPKVSNVNGVIEDAVLCGPYASAFQLVREGDGSYQLRLKENTGLGKGSYKLYFVFYLNNGIRIESKGFTVKV